jgi:co-chaperonin GroES (HSP10)
MLIKAISDKVIVKELARSQTKGGIVIPTTSKAEPQGYGKVLSVGEDVSTINPDDVIMFHPNGGMAVVIDDYVCRVLMYKEVYCIMQDNIEGLTPVTIGTKD